MPKRIEIKKGNAYREFVTVYTADEVDGIISSINVGDVIDDGDSIPTSIVTRTSAELKPDVAFTQVPIIALETDTLAKGDVIEIIHPGSFLKEQFILAEDPSVGDTILEIEETEVESLFPAGSYIGLSATGISARIRETERGVSIIAEGQGIGKITQELDGFYKTVSAELYSSVKANSDLQVLNTITGEKYVFQPSDDLQEGEVTITLKNEQYFKAQTDSPILVVGERQFAEFAVSPDKIQSTVESSVNADAIGRLTGSFLVSGNINIVALEEIDEQVELDNGQTLLLEARDEQDNIKTQRLVVDGNQILTPPTDNLTVLSVSAVRDFIAGQAWVREPSYSTTTRVKQVDNRVDVVASNVSDVEDTVAGITVQVGNFDPTDFGGADLSNLMNNVKARSIMYASTTGPGNEVSLAFVDVLAGTESNAVIIKGDNIQLNGDTEVVGSFITKLNTDGIALKSDANVIIRSSSEPQNRPSGDNLVDGDIWIDTSDGDRPYTYNGSNFIQSYTVIDGGNIDTGTVTANKIKIDDSITLEPSGALIAETDANNYVQLSNAGLEMFTGGQRVVFLPSDGSQAKFSGGIEETTWVFNTNDVLKTADDPLGADDGILINSSGIYAGEAGQGTANANVRILSNGNVNINGTFQSKSLDFYNTTLGTNGSKIQVTTSSNGLVTFQSVDSAPPGGGQPITTGVEFDLTDSFNVGANGPVFLGGSVVILEPGVNGLELRNLPTSAPTLSNRMWNDSGTLKIS